MKLKRRVLWLAAPLALAVGFVPVLLRERVQDLQHRMPGLWRSDKEALLWRISSSDDAFLPAVNTNANYKRQCLFEIVDEGQVHITGDGPDPQFDTAQVEMSDDGGQMILTFTGYGYGTASNSPSSLQGLSDVSEEHIYTFIRVK